MSTNLATRIQQVIHAKLMGRKIDLVGCVDTLLELAKDAGEIRCGLASERTLRVAYDGETCEVEVDAAQAKLRMLCARLGTLCNNGEGSPVSPYGGEGIITSAHAPSDRWAVRFKNTPDEQEFAVAPLSFGPRATG